MQNESDTGEVRTASRAVAGRFHLAPPALGPAYLLAITEGSSQVHALPADGEVVIGRGPDCEVRIDESSVSRRHVRIRVTGERTWLEDLGSQNGTFVDGEAVVSSRELLANEVISIGGATLIFHSHRRGWGNTTIVDFGTFRRRVVEELARSVRSGQPLALACVRLAADTTDAAEITSAIADRLRLTDLLSRPSRDQIWVSMPSTGALDPEALSRRLLAIVSELAPDAKVGLTTSPREGCDVEALLAAAGDEGAVRELPEARGRGEAPETLRIGTEEVVLADPAMKRLYGLIDRIAPTDLPVLVWGETGTGKELAARRLHERCPRSGGPFVALNCAAVPESLIESELFGHERGAYTGAEASKKGVFERAQHGTLLLDEIGDLPLGVQAKLLRVVESAAVSRVGGEREISVDVRIVAATNLNLAERVEAGRFRRDLFYRLNAATLWLPPLRDRPAEIAALARRFARQSEATGTTTPVVTEGALRVLARHPWPGNVRELKNLIRYLVATAPPDGLITASHVTDYLGRSARSPAPPPAPSVVAAAEPESFRPIDEEVRALEKDRMRRALAATGGNKKKAASLIHMALRTFMAKAKQYGL